MVTARKKSDVLEMDDSYDSDGDLVDLKSMKPAKLISRDVLEKQGKIANKRKLDAMSKTHDVEPHDGWKKQLSLWQEADEDTRKSYVYGMVISDGAGSIGGKFICDYFGIKPKDLEPYKVILAAAEAALALKVKRNQLSIFLLREDSHDGKFFLGKQYAMQTQNPVHAGVEDNKAESAGVNFNIKVIGGEEEPIAQTESPVSEKKDNFH